VLANIHHLENRRETSRRDVKGGLGLFFRSADRGSKQTMKQVAKAPEEARGANDWWRVVGMSNSRVVGMEAPVATNH